MDTASSGSPPPRTGSRRPISEDLLESLDSTAECARELSAEPAWQELRNLVVSEGNDARWMRETYAQHQSMADLVWQQAERWRAPVQT